VLLDSAVLEFAGATGMLHLGGVEDCSTVHDIVDTDRSRWRRSPAVT